MPTLSTGLELTMPMISFIKAHGNGNDFIIFNADNCPEIIRDPNFIQAVCNRHKGIGADGTLIISGSGVEGVEYKLDYYNCDGTWETFCANGSRCAAVYYLAHNDIPGRFTFITGDGEHWAERLPNGFIGLQIKAPKYVGEQVEPCGYRGRHVDSGARHFVAEVNDLSVELVAADGPGIRQHDHFQPRGINANFYKRINEHTIEVITYEKGVEAVMQSCASGSAAAAYHAYQTGVCKSPLKVINPGGELILEFDDQWEHVSIIGPAVLVYSAQLPDNFMAT